MPAPSVAAYQSLAEQIEQGLSEGQRKETHFAAYRMRRSRG
jgi:hypothetical protein